MTSDAPTVHFLNALLERATGQRLTEDRAWRIDTVLAPLLREQGVETPAALTVKAATDPAVAERIVDLLLNHETSFFRDQAVFATLGQQLLPALEAQRAETRRLRIWCAGCSTGQEVYSLAMMLAGDDARWRGWTLDILGTDVSKPAIARATDGTYGGLEIQRGLPVAQMLRWFDPVGDDWRAKPALVRLTRFAALNLLTDAPADAPFDLVLCRNLLIYLTPERKRTAFVQLARAIAPDGYLLLGAGETVTDLSDRFVPDQELRGVFRPAVAARRAA